METLKDHLCAFTCIFFLGTFAGVFILAMCRMAAGNWEDDE